MNWITNDNPSEIPQGVDLLCDCIVGGGLYECYAVLNFKYWEHKEEITAEHFENTVIATDVKRYAIIEP